PRFCLAAVNAGGHILTTSAEGFVAHDTVIPNSWGAGRCPRNMREIGVGWASGSSVSHKLENHVITLRAGPTREAGRAGLKLGSTSGNIISESSKCRCCAGLDAQARALVQLIFLHLTAGVER